MKTLLISLTFLFCLAGKTLYGQTAPKEKRVKTIAVKTMIYCDHCKICESCGGRILKELYNEEGIKSTEVDSKANTISVTYDSKKTSPEVIRQRISKLGFDADEIKADPEAVAKLDDCCKKP